VGDDETVRVLIQSKSEGREVYAQTELALKAVKKAVSDFSEAQANGLTIAAAYRHALKSMRDTALESGLSFGEFKSAVKAATHAIDEFRLVEAAGLGFDEAQRKAVGSIADQYQKEAAAATEAAGATTAASAAAFGGIPAWLGWTAAIAGVLAVLYPFVVLVGSAAVALISFTAGAAGAALALGGAVGLFGTIAAVVFALASSTGKLDVFTSTTKTVGGLSALQSMQRQDLQLSIQRAQAQVAQAHTTNQLATAHQHLYDAQRRLSEFDVAHKTSTVTTQSSGVNKLSSDFKALAHSLGVLAVPAAKEMIKWLDGLIPIVRNVGGQIIKWFGQELPGVLKGLSQMVKDLTPDFENFGKFLGSTFDHVAKSGIGGVFEGGVRGAIKAVEGLITNMVRLSDWFIKEWPTLKPIVEEIFGKIGSWIQWVADHWATLTDFIENKWPATVKKASDTLSQLKDWWDKNGKTIETFGGNLVDLMGHLNDLIGAWNTMYGFMSKIGFSPTQTIDDLNTVISALKTAYGWVTNLQSAINALSGSSSSGQTHIGPHAVAPNIPRNSTGGKLGGGTQNNNFYISNTSTPAQTAAVVARNLRKLGAVGA
jgi:hypothetical protein